MIGDNGTPQGAPEQAPEEQQTTPASTDTVVMLNAAGQQFSVPHDQVKQALQTGQYRLQTPSEAMQEQVAKEEDAKGVAGSLLAGGQSFANQALFGIPSALRDANQTPEQRERQEAIDQYHQAARFIGGVGGVATSLLAGGEVFKGLDLAGQAAERALLPAEEMAQAGLTRTLASKAANYATQGALMASPQAVIQAAAGDPKAAAETLFWGMGAGGILGLGAGALGKAGETALSALSDENLTGKLDQFANERALKVVGAERSQLNKLAGGKLEELGNVANEFIKPGMTRQEVGDAIAAAADKEGENIGSLIKRHDDLIRNGTTEQDLTAYALKPGQLGDAISKELNVPELSMPMNADQKKALDMVIDSANQIKTTKVNGQEVVLAEDAQKFVQQLRRKWLNSINKEMNEGGIKGLETITPLDSMKSAAYQVAKNTMHESIDTVAKAAGDTELYGALATAKNRYRQLSELEGFANTLDRQDAGNRLLSLTDAATMGHGPVSNLMAGAMGAAGHALMPGVGGFIGAGIGKSLGTGVDLLLKRWGENRGLVYMAHYAKRAAQEGPEVLATVLASDANNRLAATMQQIPSVLKQMAQQQSITHTPDFLKHLIGNTQGLSQEAQHQKLASHLTALSTNPAAIASFASQYTAPFDQTAPQLANQFRQQIMDSVMYLGGSVPKPTQPPGLFAPPSFSPTATQAQEFRDKAEVVVNPYAVMKHMQNGTLSPSHMDALTKLYPAVYQQMRNEIVQFAAKNPDFHLPVKQRDSIATFMGAPTEMMMQPQALLSLQSRFTKPTDNQGGNQSLSSKSRPSQASAFDFTKGNSGDNQT